MATQQHGCRRAARLLSEQRDRELQLGERLGLRLHLWMCTGCLRFSRQLDLMDEAGRRWRSERDSSRDGD
jgi:hypothetical protein